jgi:site-specific DNA recombinase
MTRVAIYTRISSARRDDEVGVKRQEALCREYADQRGLTVVAVEEDNSVSATKDRARPAWQSLLGRISNGEIDAVLVWHTDRLYRKLSDLDQLIRLVHKHEGLLILSVIAGDIDLSTSAGILNAQILGAVAGNEVRHKSERQVAKAREMAHAGQWSGNRVPLGYRVDPADKHNLVIDPVEADILRRARGSILAGNGILDTARCVNAELAACEVPRAAIASTTLKNLLMSPTLAGLRVYVPQAERERLVERRREGRTLATDYDFQASHLHPGIWKPIFSEAEYKSIRSFLRSPDRVNPGRAPKSLLSGVLRCGLCNSSLGYSRSNKLKPSYKCSDDHLLCTGIGISAAPIEQYVLQIVGSVLRQSKRWPVSTAPRAAVNTGEIDRLKDVKRRYLDLYDSGRLDYAELDERLAAIEGSIASITLAEESEYEAAERSSRLPDTVSRWGELSRPVEGAIPQESWAELRAIIKQNLTQVTILPTQKIWGRRFQPLRVVPWWKNGDEPSLQDHLAALQHAEQEQIANVASRKAATVAQRQVRTGPGGRK